MGVGLYNKENVHLSFDILYVIPPDAMQELLVLLIVLHTVDNIINKWWWWWWYHYFILRNEGLNGIRTAHLERKIYQPCHSLITNIC